MTAPMSDAEIREALARAERATGGECIVRNRYSHGGGRMYREDGPARDLILDVYDEANREFYFSARTDVPRLAADLLAARAERDEARQRAERFLQEINRLGQCAEDARDGERREYARAEAAETELAELRRWKDTHSVGSTLRTRAETAERERDEARAAWAEGAAALVEGQKRLEAELVVARAQLSERVIAPDRCPLTGLPFFMAIDGIATYGGPYDSYTIPTRDDDETYTRSHYDHDEGGWSEDERIGLTVLSEEAEEARGEAIARADAAEARCLELEGFVRGFLHASSGTRNENAAALLSRLETRAQVLLSPPPPHTCQIHRATSGASDCGLSPCEEATVHTDRGAARPATVRRVQATPVCPVHGAGVNVDDEGRCVRYVDRPEGQSAYCGQPTEATPFEADTAHKEAPHGPDCHGCGGAK